MECLENESQSNTLSVDICRCCLSRNSDTFQIKHSSGNQTDHYLELLKDTFGIRTTSQQDIDTKNVVICEKCAVQIHAATEFKRQVLNSESDLQKYLQLLKADSESRPPSPAASPVDVPPRQLQQSPLRADTDDAITEVKLEVEGEEPVKRRRKTENREKPKRRDRTSVGISKETLSLKAESTKDWAKLAERRGAGPLRRQTSLALLQHSTLAAFQWHRSRYRCYCCQEPFSDVAELRDHAAAHTLQEIEKKIILQQNRLVKVEISSLSCKICDSPIEDITSLTSHLTDHGVALRSPDSLLVPFRLGAALRCQLCREPFSQFRLLNMHMNRHYQNQVCHICGAAFSNLVFLNLHKTRSHRPARCSVCAVELPGRREQRAHEAAAHAVKHPRRARFPCPHCDERFHQEDRRVRHLVERHGLARPQHQCGACPKVFITRSLRNSHARHVHLKQRTRECDVCRMRFYSVSDVNRHKVTHTGEKNFLCDLCHSVFASRDSLRRHAKRAHAGS